MLSKAQKIILYLSAVAALILGVVLVVPFRTIPGVTVETGKVAMIIELGVKLALLLPILSLSVYPCILKYKQINGMFERSRVINVIGYLPIAVYTSGLITLNLHLLSYCREGEQLGAMLGTTAWVAIFLIFLFDLAFIVVGFTILDKFLMKLTKRMTVVFDIAILVIALLVCAGTCALSFAYQGAYGNDVEFFGKGSEVLFFIYVLGLVAFVTIAISTYNIVRKDATELYVNFDLQREQIEKVKAVAYSNAYNDVLDEFEDYFEEEYILNEIVGEDAYEEETEEAVEEVVEETIKETPEQQAASEAEAIQEVVVVKDEEELKRIAELEAQLSELNETHSDKLEDLQEDLEEAAEKAEAAQAEAEQAKVAAESAKNEAEIAKAEAEALKAAAAAKVAEAEAEAAKKAALAAEKAKLLAEAKNAIRPSYMNLVNYASALEDDQVVVVSNDKENQHKFYFNKKLFLVLADTNADYRITFLASKQSAIDLIIENPKNVTKATSPKGPHWYKLVNKGTFEGEQLKSIIKGALEQQKVLLQEVEEEKARIKAEKAAAKKAAKAEEKAE